MGGKKNLNRNDGEQRMEFEITLGDSGMTKMHIKYKQTERRPVRYCIISSISSISRARCTRTYYQEIFTLNFFFFCSINGLQLAFRRATLCCRMTNKS